MKTFTRDFSRIKLKKSKRFLSNTKFIIKDIPCIKYSDSFKDYLKSCKDLKIKPNVDECNFNEMWVQSNGNILTSTNYLTFKFINDVSDKECYRVITKEFGLLVLTGVEIMIDELEDKMSKTGNMILIDKEQFKKIQL